MLDKKKRSAGDQPERSESKGTTDIIADETPKNKGGGKNKYWAGVLYPENMVDDWETQIGDLVQLPYEYGKHDLDTDSQSVHRKDHVHLILVWPSPTTYNHAMMVFNKLSAEGKRACNTIEPIINIRHMHDYLIHDTQTCRKQGKHQYPASARVSGNNFDIGSFEQISLADKRAMCKELCKAIKEQGFTNFMDFFCYVMDEFDDTYFEVIQTHSGLFERMTKGNFQKWQSGQLQPRMEVDPSTGEVIEDV